MLTLFRMGLFGAAHGLWGAKRPLLPKMCHRYHRNSQYQKEFDELMENFCQIGVSMSVKMHCLRSYLDYFLENCGDFNEEQGEHFHQDISDMEKHYQD